MSESSTSEPALQAKRLDAHHNTPPCFTCIHPVERVVCHTQWKTLAVRRLLTKKMNNESSEEIVQMAAAVVWDAWCARPCPHETDRPRNDNRRDAVADTAVVPQWLRVTVTTRMPSCLDRLLRLRNDEENPNYSIPMRTK
jgi:hypothetical protein